MFFAFLSGSELLFVTVIVVVLFGASRLPQLGKALGEGIFQFRNALSQSQQNKKALPEKTSQDT
ncbi:MAG TPA: twin-arginine translocase TatA/TatE family subunit [Myxococcales bacterium]|nr:twin-arginine translocase TatA/TatE family subunit [Deltaproteobacteria bacterium]MBU54126.1 twin-arginine translocase TatA/TatE family subunit [Deltaproteobacteria bacterium]HAA55621.1 twin-arginine translocase TatA/TatE family subunit [Myxococcales bacterium]|tara:strand:- start:16675 stop:16866 length:192 start_codon:yes stop_codon:yes gene_type:complete